MSTQPAPVQAPATTWQGDPRPLYTPPATRRQLIEVHGIGVTDPLTESDPVPVDVVIDQSAGAP